MTFKVQQILIILLGIILLYLPAMAGEAVFLDDASGIWATGATYILARALGFAILAITVVRYLVRPLYVEGTVPRLTSAMPVDADRAIGALVRFFFHVDSKGRDLDKER